jgi:hypothetical protein
MAVIFGAGPAAVDAAILMASQTAVAQTYLDMSSKDMALLLTTNRHHICDLTVVLEKSNNNYGSETLLRDRVFDIFVDSSSVDAGVGPTKPTFLRKFLMSGQEPGRTVAAG